MADMILCSVDGCDKEPSRKGLCNAHYLRQRRHGDPLAGRRPPNDPAYDEAARKAVKQALARKHYLENADAYKARAAKQNTPEEYQKRKETYFARDDVKAAARERTRLWKLANPDRARENDARLREKKRALRPLKCEEVKSTECSVDGCDAKIFAKGWCSTHYSRWRTQGDHLYEPKPKMVRGPCSVEGCDTTEARGGMCDFHYMRNWKHGDPLAGGARKASQRKGENHCGKRVCPAAMKIRQFMHYDANKSEYISRANNRPIEDRRGWKRNWALNNPALVAINARQRKSAIKQAAPKWLTKEQWREMDDLYRECRRLTKETGIPHHVDHIVPLRGGIVSGLHVPWNLRVITAIENVSRPRIYRPE